LMAQWIGVSRTSGAGYKHEGSQIRHAKHLREHPHVYENVLRFRTGLQGGGGVFELKRFACAEQGKAGGHLRALPTELPNHSSTPDFPPPAPICPSRPTPWSGPRPGGLTLRLRASWGTEARGWPSAISVLTRLAACESVSATKRSGKRTLCARAGLLKRLGQGGGG
jgi:hypothetical protein